MTTSALAAVLREPDQPYRLELVELADPGPGEILVRIAGAGLCHSDTLLRRPGILTLPVIPGHEGSGVVESVGPEVHDIRPGDHVVLSFDACGGCANCLDAQPAYCAEPAQEHSFVLRNWTGRRLDGSTPARDASGAEVGACWFQQSSCATHTVALARNAVVVDRDLPLEILGPLGCGVLTGAGAVLNSLGVRPGCAFGVFGAGAVGLSAIMAAQLAGAGPIVAVDRNPARLELAKELGATHVVTAGEDLPARVRSAIGGPLHRALDTTGVPEVISAGIQALAQRGVLGLVAAQTGDLAVTPLDLAVGRSLTGILLGDAVPRRLIPHLADLWRQGRFPFDRIITTFPLAEINAAEQAAARGDVVKPLLVAT